MFGMLMALALVIASPEASAERPQLQAQSTGEGAHIHTWMSGDATDKLVGGRNWYCGGKWLYIAMSVEELKVVRDDLGNNGWPWMDAQDGGDDRVLVSVWGTRRDAPCYMVRADFFEKLRPKFTSVHNGKLPASIMRNSPTVAQSNKAR